MIAQLRGALFMPKNEFTCDCTIVHEDAVNEVNKKMLSAELFGRLSDFFKALGDPTRTKIVWALDQRELCVCDLANVLGMTKSAVSHQLAVLRNAAFVKCRRDGKTVYYSLDDDHVKKLLEAGYDHVTE
jgi:DNA-binding transcriptional ArsR family regulator